MTIPEETLDKEELRVTLADVIDVEPTQVSDDTDFIDHLQVDSLLALEVVVALEKKYRVKFTETEMRSVRTLRAAHGLLQGKLRES
ncbi:acyl carrier protein [Amycolatopsis cihanbeyliensis]|uniref:Acyl carrier protein n=1 Tax=Amycolatopsis cihanbeyliensis TaxID=1128664 RepID=A0A542DE96_AMYCI|nr:acyl carrier protein [Amycolatopsis cihanbeyliensis]TQJ01372.1 acyl carrier protein [Amycolatopsis cihanbeyliensis]